MKTGQVCASVSARTSRVLSLYLCLQCLLVSQSPNAATTTLSFDEIGDDIAITNQYQSRGVLVTGANAINAGALGFGAHSGTQVAYAPSGLMTFTLTVGDIKSVSTYMTGPVNIGIFAYDSSNNLLGQAVTSSASVNTLLSVTSSSAAIATVQIHNGGASFAIDDLSFIGAPTQSTYNVIPLTLGKSPTVVLPQGINGSGAVAGFGTTAQGVIQAFTISGASIQNLGTLGGPSSMAHAITNQGQILGTAQTSRKQWHAFSWLVGTGMTDVGTLGGNSSDALAANASGQVVGFSETRNGQQHAFLWTAGGLTDLGTLGGKNSFAVAINTGGRVVGGAENRAGQGRAFSWTASEGMVDLGTLGGTTSAAIGVNVDGAVVGSSLTASKQPHAFYWRPGTNMVDIGTLGGKQSLAVGLNDAGKVIGSTTNASGQPRAFSWQTGGSITDLGTLGGNGSSAVAINQRGDIVGTAQATSGEWRAVLWSATNGTIDLNSKLVNPPSGIILFTALAVGDNGAIVALSNKGVVLLRPQN
ncbi:hypothetical protein [Cupriavidus pauculus]|uniref:hypothetical protein n=1 Tax=Cupriavidus pauculus TaxID=82633 RepID=UPI001EE32EBF|nr:hypothetical protein [Cupriavidus pauculus]GJG96655.1 hypothetical protein CBA19C6_19220 [Cupriavidus pauculus]